MRSTFGLLRFMLERIVSFPLNIVGFEEISNVVYFIVPDFICLALCRPLGFNQLISGGDSSVESVDAEVPALG